jgi:hypothetical protein
LISPDQIERVTLIRDGEVVETLEIGDMLVSQAQNKEDLAAIIQRHMFARSGIKDVPLSEFVRVAVPSPSFPTMMRLRGHRSLKNPKGSRAEKPSYHKPSLR